MSANMYYYGNTLHNKVYFLISSLIVQQERAYNGLEWVDANPGYIPANAILAGHQANGKAVYVGRALVDGHTMIGKVSQLIFELNSSKSPQTGSSI